jgi:copper chaperone CopZ
MVKQRFRIEGMHCVGCALTVDGALEDLPGVKSSSTNYARQIADVEYDERRVDAARILTAIQAAGYRGQAV